MIAHAAGATVIGLLLLIPLAPRALACQAAPIPVADIARDVDRVVIGRVTDVDGVGPWTYGITVERILKGGSLPTPWVIEDAGASDCGMPRLERGDHAVLEYYEPGQVGGGPWFYAWKIQPDGTLVDASGIHAAPAPSTLLSLLAAYRSAGLPDTATRTETLGTQADPYGFVVPVGIGVAGGVACLVLSRRKRSMSSLP